MIENHKLDPNYWNVKFKLQLILSSEPLNNLIDACFQYKHTSSFTNYLI